jgi:hypothetical protein
MNINSWLILRYCRLCKLSEWVPRQYTLYRSTKLGWWHFISSVNMISSWHYLNSLHSTGHPWQVQRREHHKRNVLCNGSSSTRKRYCESLSWGNVYFQEEAFICAAVRIVGLSKLLRNLFLASVYSSVPVTVRHVSHLILRVLLVDFIVFLIHAKYWVDCD